MDLIICKKRRKYDEIQFNILQKEMIHSNPKILPGKIIHQLENIAPEPTETKYDLNCRCNDGSTLRSPHCPQEFLHVSNKSLSLKLMSKDGIFIPD